MEQKYLYGASVQGIQNYIFQTNKLRDIIGASNLVNKICDEGLRSILGNRYDPSCDIIHAAGNIKYEFTDRELCAKVVREFPRWVMNTAPGITLSQSVVIEENNDFKEAVSILEKKLRTARNKPMRSTTLGLMGICRSRTTGLPAVRKEDNDYLDIATIRKREAADDKSRQELCKMAFGIQVSSDQFAYDIQDLCDSNNWLAIIHADGNGLGMIVREVGNDKNRYREFSNNLSRASKEAAQAAYNDIKDDIKDENGRIPIRPIVLGGDDFTVVCRGNIAIDYTQCYLKHFEEKAEEITHHKLTACAGVAFIKSNYPFYYGYRLSEELCEAAKKDAKNEKNIKDSLAPSCLMFHKIQDSFVTSYDDIVERELKPGDNISYQFGPYYLKPHGDYATVEKLLEWTGQFKNEKGNALKNGLRQWMTLVADKGEKATKTFMSRLQDITNKKELLKELRKGRCLPSRKGDNDDSILRAYPVFDVLSLCSIITKVNKKVR